ncbi:MAG TPA: (Fe-S)-binding protein [Chthoniobacterales bacterium]|nr:(Fe-S)-binding protein [Chthoniobacterales bacterium]
MLTLPERIVFTLLAALSLYYTYLGFREIIAVVKRGQPEYYSRTNRALQRVREAILQTITQVTVFRNRPIVGFFHSFIFYGFSFYLLVNLADVVEGYFPGHWFTWLGSSLVGCWFRAGADILGFLVLIGVIYFLWRRFIRTDSQLERFNEPVLLHPTVRAGGVRRDSFIVAAFIFFHVGFRLFGAGSLLAAEGRLDGWQPIASVIACGLGFGPNRIIGWHFGWWISLGLILAFLPYFVRSKHIHLFVAPIRLGLGRRDQIGRKVGSGSLDPISFDDESTEQFGVAKLEQFRFTQILDPYACIQCNRCTNVCPAHVTGKALAPSAIEINKRYELNSIRSKLASGSPSPRPVMEFALNESALWACTTCGACVEACPVGCEQLTDIVDLRRDAVMTKGQFPQELNGAFRNMERSGNPWGVAHESRADWPGRDLKVPTVEENPDFEVLYWVGCAGAYDPSAQKIARSLAEILTHARVSFAILGNKEKCTGDPARRAGNEYLYFNLATENVETLNALLQSDGEGASDEELEAKPVMSPEAFPPERRNLEKSRLKRIVTTCPHCFNALTNDYQQLGGNYRVLHHSQLIEELIKQGRLPEMILSQKVTYHDPCYLGRHNGVYQAPRTVLSGGHKAQLKEMPRNRNHSFCCGAGGAQFWKEEEPGTMRVGENRFREAEQTGAEVIASGCPFCKSMLSSSESAGRPGAPQVLDIAELVVENLRRSKEKLGLW